MEVPITDSYYRSDCRGTAHLGNSQEQQASDRDLPKIRHNANECRPLDSRTLSGSQTEESLAKPKMESSAFVKINKQTIKIMDGSTEHRSPRKLRTKLFKNETKIYSRD